LQHRHRLGHGEIAYLDKGFYPLLLPVAMADGSVILGEIAGGAVTRVAPDGTLSEIGKAGGGPNGLALGPDGAAPAADQAAPLAPASAAPAAAQAAPPAPAGGSAPMTVAWGSRDLLLPHALQARRARRELPQARHITLPGLGHVPFWDDPEMVSRVILGVLVRV